MNLSSEQIDSLWNKFYTIGAKALLIRDFWKANTDTLTIIFDGSVNKDPWLIHKFEVFNAMWERKPTDGYKRVGKIFTGLGGVDSFYKEMIYCISEGEYTQALQDEKTMSILDDLLSKYPEDSYIDLFSFSRNGDEKIDYLEIANPLLSLLRLEYEKLIEIKDILLFSFPFSKKDEFFIEGKIRLKKLKHPMVVRVSEPTMEVSTFQTEKDIDIIRLNENLKYSKKTGIFTHVKSNKTYDVGTQSRKLFIDIIIDKGLEGVKAEYRDFGFVLGKKTDKDGYLSSENEDKIRNFGKRIKRSLVRAFKLSNEEATFYSTSKGFRLIPYKPE